MSPAFAVCLTICAPEAQVVDAVNVEIQIQDLKTAPTLSPLPEGMPDPRDAPTDGRWVDNDGSPRPAGTYLPSPLDREIMQRLRLLERLPGVVQVQLNELHGALDRECAGRLAVTEARCIAERIREDRIPDDGWSTLEMLGALLIGFAVGAGGVGVYCLTMR